MLTAPLGLIGVAGALLLFHKPFGFVAMLGTIAMLGIIMRNSVILVDQIDRDIREGADPLPGRSSARRCGASGRSRSTAAAAVLGADPAGAGCLLRAHGGRAHGRNHGGHRFDAVLPARCSPYAAWFRVPADAPAPRMQMIAEGSAG